MSDAVNVSDARPRGFFIVDNAIIRQHGKALGAYGVAVYSALCMYADRGGRCTPSYRTIGADLNISPRQVMREIDKIVGLSLARVDHRPTGKGNLHQSNVYTLLPVGGGSDCQSQGCDYQSWGVVTTSHGVVTDSHTNKTQEQEQEQEGAADAATPAQMTSIPSAEDVTIAPPSPKPRIVRNPSAHQLMVGAIFEVRGLDTRLASVKERANVGTAATAFLAIGATPDDVRDAWRIRRAEIVKFKPGERVTSPSVGQLTDLVSAHVKAKADGPVVDLPPGHSIDPVTGRRSVNWRLAR